MEATSTRRHKTHPMSYYKDLVKDMDNSQKLELMTILIDSVKPIRTEPFADTFEEEDFSDMDKELYSPEEAYEMTMKDIKAIYDHQDAI